MLATGGEDGIVRYWRCSYHEGLKEGGSRASSGPGVVGTELAAMWHAQQPITAMLGFPNTHMCLIGGLGWVGVEGRGVGAWGPGWLAGWVGRGLHRGCLL